MRKLAIASAAFFAAALSAAGAAAQVSNGTVKIGVMTDTSSYLADVVGKGSIAAAQLAIEDVGGKAAGMPIELIFADHQNKPDVGAALAREWYDRENVDMIVDVPASAVAIAVQGVAREKNRIAMFTSATSDALTNDQCSPNGFHWTQDSYSLGKVLATALAKAGGSKWFFIVVDTTGGKALADSARPFIEAAGGTVLGIVRHPMDAGDLSSFLLQAKASGADYIVFGNGGKDLVNSVRQAHEFHVVPGKQQLAAIPLFLSDLYAMGLENGQGLLFSTGFYWDRNDETRAWSKRFFAKMGKMPTDVQTAVYSAVRHYLKAVEAVGSDDPAKVLPKMRELPVNDVFAQNGHVREDGRLIKDMYLLRAKTPEASKGEWDLAEIVSTIKGDDAFRPLSESRCRLVKK